MNLRYRRRFERVIRVLSFLHEHTADFPATGNVGSLIQSLEKHRSDLEAAISSQKPERINKAESIKNVSTTCRQIGTIARAIIRRDKTFVGNYKLPAPITDVTLIGHVDSLLAKFETQPDDDDSTRQAKTQLRARFTAFEIAPDFVETLRQQRNTLRDTIEFNQIKTQTGVETTSRIGSVLDSAHLDILDLDAIMLGKFVRQPDKLKAWRSASHLETTSRKPAGAAATP